jgi:hypothetical protein
LSVFLATIGLLAGGDLLTGKFSIGGADARVPNTFPGSTGYAPGIDRHGTCEVDASITREDTYFGNNANFIFQRWNEYVAIANQNGGNFNMATQAQDGVSQHLVLFHGSADHYAGIQVQHLARHQPSIHL